MDQEPPPFLMPETLDWMNPHYQAAAADDDFKTGPEDWPFPQP
jgi:hypothetical protein